LVLGVRQALFKIAFFRQKFKAPVIRNPMNRPFLLYPLIALHLFNGISALAGGAMLMLQPDGYLLGMEIGWLNLLHTEK